MRLNPQNVDPTRLIKPTNVARMLGVHPSMVTHWMQGGTLDFLEVDDVKFVSADSVAVLKAMRDKKREAAAEKAAEAIAVAV